jgi:hypothetical protein
MLAANILDLIRQCAADSLGLDHRPTDQRQGHRHRENTAHEIWRQIRGVVDCFVAGVRSSGTVLADRAERYFSTALL